MKNFNRNASNLRDAVQSMNLTIMLWHNMFVEVILNGIPDSVSDDTLEESVISVLADTDVFVEHQDIEACHRLGKADRQISKKKTV